MFDSKLTTLKESSAFKRDENIKQLLLWSQTF